MKKIFLSILALGLLVVACDKQDDMVGAEPITAIEIEEAGIATGSHDDAFAFISAINDGVNAGKLGTSEKSSASKAGDFGSNWIQILFFDYTIAEALGERDYAYVRSDNYAILCPDVSEDTATDFVDVMTGVSEISYSLIMHPNSNLHSAGFSQLIIETIDGTGTVSSTRNVNTAGWAATFAADFDRIFPSLGNRSGITGGIAPQASRFDTTCAAGVDLSTFYAVAPAPFPLTGFLATIIDQSMFAGTSLNYAATTEAAVRTTIEADIMQE